MQKRGKEKGRLFWLLIAALLATAGVAAPFVWYWAREPGTVSLKYGEFKQILQDRSVTVQKLGPVGSELRGEIMTDDLAKNVTALLVDGGW